MNKIVLAHGALFALNILYTVSYFVVKGVSPTYLSPSAFVFVRAIGACLLFWLAANFFPKERVAKKDLLKIGFACFFGVVINQLSFFHGLVHTAPTSTAIMMTTTPLFALPLSYLMLKERVTIVKIGGVLIGFIGASIIILQTVPSVSASRPLLGNSLILLNAITFTFYLVYTKQLLAKYHLLTVLKWLFLFGSVVLIPISAPDFSAVTWDFPVEIWWGIGYVIVGITFLTFALNMFALKHLSPNVVTSYIFTQPILTAVFSFYLEGKTMSYLSVMASVLIFIGVYFVSIRKG